MLRKEAHSAGRKMAVYAAALRRECALLRTLFKRVESGSIRAVRFTRIFPRLLLPPPRRRAALPLGQIKGQKDFHRQGVAAGDAVDEDFGGHLAHFLDGDVDGGEHGGEVLGGVDVVDADDGDVPGDF